MLKINQLCFIGYLHALKLVSLVRVSLVGVLVGSDYLHTLKLVSLVCVSLVGVLVGVPWFVWFVLVGSGYLHTLNLVSLLLGVPCWFVWLVSWLEVVTCMP